MRLLEIYDFSHCHHLNHASEQLVCRRVSEMNFVLYAIISRKLFL